MRTPSGTEGSHVETVVGDLITGAVALCLGPAVVAMGGCRRDGMT
ncbi:hypothetical protein [Streptomyces sp. NPDC058623]